MAVQPNSYRGFRVTRGDATGAQLAILLPDTYRVLHLASGADFDTDWNVSNPTHPTFYVHSETTPATDYIAFDHDATDGTINVASGNLKLALSGTDVLTLTTTALAPTVTDVGALGTTALMWADLFLAVGGVINFDNGDVTLTHAANGLTIAGGDTFIADANGVILGYTAQIAVDAITPELQMHGTAPADSSVLIGAWSADAVAGKLYFAKARGAIGTFTIIVTADVLGEVVAFGSDGVDFNSNANASAAIRFVSTGTIGADRVPAEIRFLTATNAAPSVLTERFRIDETGVVQAGVYTNANVTAAGAGIFAGGIAFTDVANAWIDDATQGSGTTTHYIGNQTITTSSDMRVKDDISDWQGSALSLFRQAHLVEFTYNLPGGGPQHTGYGPNARGRYVGFLAQEMIDWAPWAINAGAGKDCPQCSQGLPCRNESHAFWHVQYDHLVPLVVRGLQEIDQRIAALEAR